MLRFSAVGVSNVGLVRRNNEDAGFVGPTCLVVADGVGGAAAGEIASATTAFVVAATALARREDPPDDMLVDAVAAAQAEVGHGIDLDPHARLGMATTLTALATDGQRVALAHLGDSRGYVFRDGALTRVTRDHTYVQDLIDEGRLGEEEAREHPWRNVVMRTVNGQPDERADVVVLDLVPGDRVLLASDGLTDLVPEHRIEEMLARKSDDAAAEHLVAGALGRGGRDNVTVVIGTVVDGPAMSGDGRLLGALADPGNVVDLGAVRRASTA